MNGIVLRQCRSKHGEEWRDIIVDEKGRKQCVDDVYDLVGRVKLVECPHIGIETLCKDGVIKIRIVDEFAVVWMDWNFEGGISGTIRMRDLYVIWE